MYYKDSPYGQASYPQTAYQARAPLLPQGYGNEMYSTTTMDTIKGYFTNPWVVVVAAILVVMIIVWLMGGKENYH